MYNLVENYTNAVAFLESLNNAVGFTIIKPHEIEQAKDAVRDLKSSVKNLKKNVDALESQRKDFVYDNIDGCIHEIVKNIETIRSLVVIVGQRYMAYVDAEKVG